METLPDNAIEELPDDCLKNMINDRIKITQYQWHDNHRRLNSQEKKEVLNRIPKVYRPGFGFKNVIWFISSPDGEIFSVRNLSEFCKKNNINYTSLYNSFKYCNNRRKENWKIIEKQKGSKVFHAGYDKHKMHKWQKEYLTKKNQKKQLTEMEQLTEILTAI